MKPPITHEAAWNRLLVHDELREVVVAATAALRDLLDERGWSGTLVEDLAPLFLFDFFSPYSHLNATHPGAILPYDEDLPGPYLLEHGLILIGFAPNGDFIAVDAIGDPGAVVYVAHEEFDYDDLSNLSEITRQVAGSVSEYLLALHQKTAPLDSWDQPER
jgi:hypothetical protein